MTYHEPTRTPFTFRGNEWLIYPRDKSWFAKMVKYDSDTGPFSTYEQADNFIAAVVPLARATKETHDGTE